MKRWILVTSGKGGVGKSLVARVLAEAKREREPATFERGGREVVMPRLRGWIVVDLDERHLSFATATRPGVLDYPDDEVLIRWLAAARLALEGAGELLGLPATVRT